MKNMQASLSARNVGESSFYHCGSPVKLVKACLCVGSTVFTTEEVLRSTFRPV